MAWRDHIREDLVPRWLSGGGPTVRAPTPSEASLPARVWVCLAMAVGIGMTVACGSTGRMGGHPVGQDQAAFGQQICAVPGPPGPGYHNPIAVSAPTASRLSGAGSSSVAPMMSVWAKQYAAQGGTRIAYQPIGSGGGVAQVLAGTVDFGASDLPMTPAELARANGPVLHVPVTLGAVAVVYHVHGLGSAVRFDGDVLGRIYSGRITRWDDVALQRLNPGLDLPKRPVVVVHRAEASGTTAVWTGFLTRTSPSWVAALGSGHSAGKQVVWPVGLAGKGNDGVSAMLWQVDGAIGYVELTYALDQGLPYGQVRNRAGRFVQPCPATVTRATEGLTYPTDLRMGPVDGPDPEAYPIVGMTYVLIDAGQPDRTVAVALVNFLAWALTAGQDLAAPAGYAPLGADLQRRAYDQLRAITVDGIAVVPASTARPP
jgi:phosphate transport system substrate-binding protein